MIGYDRNTRSIRREIAYTVQAFRKYVANHRKHSRAWEITYYQQRYISGKLYGMWTVLEQIGDERTTAQLGYIRTRISLMKI